MIEILAPSSLLRLFVGRKMPMWILPGLCVAGLSDGGFNA